MELQYNKIKSADDGLPRDETKHGIQIIQPSGICRSARMVSLLQLSYAISPSAPRPRFACHVVRRRVEDAIIPSTDFASYVRS